MTLQVRIESLNVGKPQLLKGHPKEVMSGFGKQGTEETLFLSQVNLDGDGQADLVHHGGVDKTVCVYCYKHYPYWEQRLGVRMLPGAFGENITLDELTEEDVCIGDVFGWGEAVVQISQPRQPCFKIAAYHQIPELTAYVEQTGYTGFYFRVLQKGKVSKADGLIKLQDDPLGVTVSFANTIMYHRKEDVTSLRTLLDVPALSDSWRNTLSKRLAKL
ncbi:MOSC domain-containing protein [Paenibacillus caui]|uniref:MOSC domain-containing protein n=1 Tax=Paenibacillus caui TaxID=2873927 RepID=UPI001CA91BF0|nr:MOSC domain-containing protein [Paenibacillus caui]